jgi:hypothetical protein
MKKIETYGHVDEKGILKISYRSKFDQAVKLFTGQRVKVTVEKIYKKRSTSGLNENGDFTRLQNGYYFGVIVKEYQNGAWEMQQRSISMEEAHNELKANCNYSEHYSEKTGEVMRSINSTSTLTTVQFEEYLIKCREFILEWFGIVLNLPNEQTELPI